MVMINQENKFVLCLDKLMKDQNKYVNSCLNHLLVFLGDNFIGITEIIENELILLGGQKQVEEQGRKDIRSKNA